jgi:outer membrane protein assembly factor BamD
MMKSTDMEAKYNGAVKYFEKKDYYHALQLFEELISVYRGTSKAEQSYFYYTYCTYYVDDFTMAAYHFNNFVQSYPNSKHAEEMQYMYAYCYYLDSPISSLDQTSTAEAIDKFQIFINKFPESTRVADANKMMDELRAKIEEKTFNNAKLYYRTGDYKAAVVAFANFQKDYPYSLYIEESMFLALRASYEYAINSIDSKRVERLKASKEEYQKLIDNFSQSRYLRDAERIYDNINKELAAVNPAPKL